MIAHRSVELEAGHPLQARLQELLGDGVGLTGHKLIPLPNLKPSDLSKFFSWRSIWGPFAAEVYGGAHPVTEDRDSGWASCTVYLADHSQLIGGGFLLQHVYSGPKRGEIIVSTWSKCAHEFESATIGRCLNRYRCVHCREYYDVDSSD